VDDGTEPIADDELLYRRVPASLPWFNPATMRLMPQAFDPHRDRDVTGLSVFRAKYKAIDVAARGRPGKSYYIAVLQAMDIRQAGIAVEPRPHTPDGFDAAHAEMPDLRSDNRKESITLERQRVLVTLCRSVEGPFETPSV
jgi:hypothetical protein